MLIIPRITNEITIADLESVIAACSTTQIESGNLQHKNSPKAQTSETI